MCNAIEQCLHMHSTISESRKHTHGINIHLPHQVVLYKYVCSKIFTKISYGEFIEQEVLLCFVSFQISIVVLCLKSVFYSYFGHSKLAFCFYRTKNEYYHVNEAELELLWTLVWHLYIVVIFTSRLWEMVWRSVIEVITGLTNCWNLVDSCMPLMNREADLQVQYNTFNIQVNEDHQQKPSIIMTRIAK